LRSEAQRESGDDATQPATATGSAWERRLHTMEDQPSVTLASIATLMRETKLARGGGHAREQGLGGWQRGAAELALRAILLVDAISALNSRQRMRMHTALQHTRHRVVGLPGVVNHDTAGSCAVGRRGH